jgi:DNA-binding transcriptional ArsR family regulator
VWELTQTPTNAFRALNGDPQPNLQHMNTMSFVLMTHGIKNHIVPPVLDAELARHVAERMQMLATPSRVQILGRLKLGPCCVGDLAEAVGMEASAVSHQLRSLRHLGFVVGERRGKQVIYGLHDSHVAELLDQAIFHVQHLALGAREPLENPAEAS